MNKSAKTVSYSCSRTKKHKTVASKKQRTKDFRLRSKRVGASGNPWRETLGKKEGWIMRSTFTHWFVRRVAGFQPLSV